MPLSYEEAYGVTAAAKKKKGPGRISWKKK